MIRTATRACSVCRKHRKCSQSADDADKLTREVKSWSPYYCLRDCLNLTPLQRSEKRKEIAAAKLKAGPKPRFAYPIIGGPLDGEYAVTSDFYSEGIYHHLTREYFEFNSAFGTRKVLGGHPSMIFVHASQLKPLARPADR